MPDILANIDTTKIAKNANKMQREVMENSRLLELLRLLKKTALEEVIAKIEKHIEPLAEISSANKSKTPPLEILRIT